MIRWLTLVAVGGLACQAPGLDESETYDVWIQGGTIVDGTGSEPVVADVVISGDTIVYLGKVSSERLDVGTIIDATGKVVTPGFIDPHSHGDPIDNFVVQGVTTVVLRQDGRTPGFVARNKPTVEQWREAIASPDGDEAVVTLARWMKAVEAKGSRTNVATLVGHGSLRLLSGVGSDKDLTDAQQGVNKKLAAAAKSSCWRSTGRQLRCRRRF